MTDKFDSWAFESGLKHTFDLKIDNARFTYDSNYNNGQTLCLVLEGTDSDGDEQRLLFSTGSGWEPGPDGATAVREDNSERRTFQRNSGVGQLGAAAVGVGAPLRDRGAAYEAKVWPGLRFRFERVKVGDGQFATERPMPVEFLEADTVTAPMSQESGGKVSRVMEVKLKKLAKDARDYDDFLEKGLELAAGNSDLEALVADEAWFVAART